MAGEFSRSFDYVEVDGDFEPCLIISRKAIESDDEVFIPMRQAWKFSEEHNENFEAETMRAAVEAYAALGMDGIAVSQKTLVQRTVALATTIQEGIDELLKMPPVESPITPVIGEATLRIGDQKFTTEVRA